MKEPPNFRHQKHEKHCGNCEHSHSAPLVGAWCDKYKYKSVYSGTTICDSWEEQKTEKPVYCSGPFFGGSNEKKA